MPSRRSTLNDPDDWSVDALDFDWDVTRPTAVDASQVAAHSTTPTTASTATPTDSGLSPARRARPADVRGPAMTVLVLHAGRRRAAS